MIKIEHLTKKYGDHVAVDDLNIELAPGKIYGFLGPNGAGKSTTMNIMTGYLAATEGTVTVNGFDIFEEPEKAKSCIGYLPELPPLYMDMTPREYLSFVADLKKVDRRKKKLMVEEIMQETGITEVANRLIRNLSKGYRQRVGIAQALIGFPPVLILDEPTVGLDPNQIMEVRELIRRLGSQHTIILSSHILSEISAVCDYVWIINKGRLVAADTPENLSVHMNQNVYYTISVKGEEAAIGTLLSGVEAVRSFTTLEKEKDTVRLRIEADQAYTGLEEELFYLFADHRMPILSSTKEEHSLEEVFMAFTAEAKEGEDEA